MPFGFRYIGHSKFSVCLACAFILLKKIIIVNKKVKKKNEYRNV